VCDRITTKTVAVMVHVTVKAPTMDVIRLGTIERGELRSEITVCCEACGEEYRNVEDNSWRLANIGPWILEHAHSCPKARSGSLP
jgi:hypothetical protein